MKWIFLLILTVGLHAQELPKTIRVLLAEGLDEVVLETHGGYRAVNPGSGETLNGGFFSKKYPMESTATGLRWGEEFPGVYQLHIEPRTRRGSLELDGIVQCGSLNFYMIDNQLSIVGEVPIDDYVRLTLAEEYGNVTHPEFLSALVVAARTRTLYEVSKNPNAFWHVRAEEVGYRPERSSEAIDQAVFESGEMILSLGDQVSLFPSVWTGHSAGKTAPYQVMFRDPHAPVLEGIDTRFAENDRNRVVWQVTVPTDELAQIVGLDRITELNTYADTDSHKVYAVRCFDGVDSRDLSYWELENLVGLRSSDFTVELRGEQVLFRGHGDGHGVGMCLYSASQMAQRGKNAKEILEIFYPDAQLLVLEEAPGPTRRDRLKARFAMERGILP